jgi:nucleoside 2-deoxyribosyltransferase
VSARFAVYLAGPLGFTESGRIWHDEVVVRAIVAAGMLPLDPWPSGSAIIAEAAAETDDELADMNDRIGEANADMIRRCDAVLALLDGTDVDSGTAAEIGFASALERPVVGLRTDLRRAGENAGCQVNLQVEHFIRASGGDIVSTIDDAMGLLRGLIDPNS